MLPHILPTLYPYKIVQSSFSSDENFQCEIRAKIDSGEDFLCWLKEFESNTNSAWILRSSVAVSSKSRHRFSRDYLCQHSDFRKKNETLKNKKCSASLTVRIKIDSRSVRSRDSFVKDGYMSVIKINFMHSHEINVAESWNWLPRSEETKRIFIDMFNTGMSPAAAANYHKAMLLSKSPESLENSRINPPARWIYRLYEKWQEENFGGLNSRPSLKITFSNLEPTENFINDNAEFLEDSDESDGLPSTPQMPQKRNLPVETPGKKRKVDPLESAFLKVLEQHTEEKDDVYHFTNLIAHKLRSFSPKKREAVMGTILNTVFKE